MSDQPGHHFDNEDDFLAWLDAPDEDESMVDLGGDMVVPLRELTHWDEED